MTLPAQHRSDWKLLLAIGAFVMASAVLIAIVAGSRAAREAARAAPPAAPATPATGTASDPAAGRDAWRAVLGDVGRAAAEKIPGSTVGAEFAEEVGTDAGAPEDEAVPVDPDADFAAVGHAAYAARDYRKAAAYWGAEAAARPERAYGHYMLGLSLWKAGRLDESEAALRRSAELNPASLRTFVNLSRVLNERGDFEGALQAAERARGLDAENPQALYLQARSLRNLGRIEDAVVALEQALAFDAEYGHARNLLGLIRIGQGRFDEAAENLRLAALHEPELPYVHANLGRALELGGRYEESARAFRAALELDPGLHAAQACLSRVERAAAAAGSEQIAASGGEAVVAAGEIAGESDADGDSAGALQ